MKPRFSKEQIITILKEAEAGAKVTELCRRHRISDATFYTWRSKYGGLEVSEIRRLHQLEEETGKISKLCDWVAERGGFELSVPLV
jgi:putative transposase